MMRNRGSLPTCGGFLLQYAEEEFGDLDSDEEGGADEARGPLAVEELGGLLDDFLAEHQGAKAREKKVREDKWIADCWEDERGSRPPKEGDEGLRRGKRSDFRRCACWLTLLHDCTQKQYISVA